MNEEAKKGTTLRVMIMTSSTGGGHDSRAYTLRDWLLAEGGCEVSVEHMLEDSSPLTRFGVWVYNTIQKHAPGLHNIYWHIAEAFSLMQGRRLSFGRDYYLAKLAAQRPHLVVSMHDCLNRGYFQEAKALLGDAVRTCTYCGEWTGGIGYSRNWLEPSADLHISRTPQALAHATSHGMDLGRCIVFCNLLPAPALAPAMDEAARSALLSSLGLDAGRFTVLLAAGAVGANNHTRLLDVLAGMPGVQAIAFCGKSERALAKVSKWKAAHPDFPLHVEGYSRRVNEFLQVAHCVVSRGGANTTAEALRHACPILFNRMGGVMPQERLTIHHFVYNGGAAEFSGPESFRRLIAKLSSPDGGLETMRERLCAMQVDDHPADLARRLLELAREAAGKEKA